MMIKSKTSSEHHTKSCTLQTLQTTHLTPRRLAYANQILMKTGNELFSMLICGLLCTFHLLNIILSTHFYIFLNKLRGLTTFFFFCCKTKLWLWRMPHMRLHARSEPKGISLFCISYYSIANLASRYHIAWKLTEQDATSLLSKSTVFLFCYLVLAGTDEISLCLAKEKKKE